MMKRIMVMGVSAGAGKSTFARKLGEKLDIDVYHLDAYFWKPNWVQASTEEFRESNRKIADQDKWIIEGNYSTTYDIRAPRADTIIYLELPLIICLYRVVKRWLTNIGNTRPDMGPGCTEKLDYQFIKFIVTTYHKRKKKMRTRFREFQSAGGPSKKVIVLRGRKAIQEYFTN